MTEGQFAAAHRGDPDHRPWSARTIHERFWEVAAEHAGRLAIAGDHDENVTYAELARRVRDIAGAVRGRARVAVLLDHGPGTQAAILGALAAGALYVPLDPRYPPARLARMAELAEPDAVLVTPEHAATAGRLAPGVPVIDVSALPPGPAEVSGPSDPDAPAYILFTSGSTGRPKGVVQTHRNALFQVRTHTANLRIGPSDRVSVLSSFSFDMAMTDGFSALLNGAASVPVDLREHGLAWLGETLAGRGVTIYHSTPTVYRHLLDSLPSGARLDSVRAVVLGGEEVVRHDLDRFVRHFPATSVFVNGYGATEISFAVQNHLTVEDIRAGRGVGAGVVPIGLPLDGTEVELRPHRAAAEAGEGEIVVRSAHLAAYWRAGESDDSRFGVDPDGCRHYRTGDLGRLLPDGRIRYLGRADRQVKIRGHRVELGEVEAALSALPQVTRAAVVAREIPAAAAGVAGVPGDKRILAYVLGDLAEPGTLRKALADVLPDFMLPAVIVKLPAFPLTPTGKVDTSALPEPAAPDTAAPPTPADAGDVAGVIAAAWCAALGVPEVSREQNFFDVGGHSLLMTQVQRSLEESLGRRLPLSTLYAHPTIAALAEHLNGGDKPHSDAEQRAARRRQARARRTPGG
ncbi:non-ribosomal peptide synthetase [Nonomuraea sp. NN258]|uniref:non-ribosomal peptide synthetase n=1 Tax=Nonomuraea antri TaxID=2730852 RepID=UPI001568C339|nr:non-ribosomal peptide synthetase [Nonomuraea antri]NRQ32606.1 non-ribosomal peptide synthetase [Nonomuraea antri]